MPTYDFYCQECEAFQEEWFSIHDEPKLVHACGKIMLKVITAPMVNMKQGKKEIIKTDNKGSYITKHWDGKQDVHVVAETVKPKPKP